MTPCPPRRSIPAAGRRRSDRGSGLLSTVLGVAFVAGLLGLAANITIGLWTRTTVDAVAYDAARDIATAPADSDREHAAAQALARAARVLGRYGDRVNLTLERNDTQVVVLRVQAPGVHLLPAMVDGGPTVGALDRRIVVRSESP